jgi:hypothetical protein
MKNICTSITFVLAGYLILLLTGCAAPTPTITANNSPICAGQTLTLTATSTTSSPTFSWTGPNSFTAGTASFSITNATVAATGVYSVTVSDPAYLLSSSAATASVTVNPVVTPSVSISASPGNTICAGSSVSLTATPTNGGAAPAYQWKLNGSNTGTNSPTLTLSNVANGDVISCVLTSNAPCLSAATAASNTITMTVVPVPVISSVTATNPTVCYGTDGKITISGLAANTGYTLNYSKNGVPAGAGTITTNASGQYVLTGLGLGTYSNITVTSSTGNCTSAAAGPVSIVNPITVPAPTAGNNGPLCAGNTLNLTASNTLAGVTYTWTGPGSFSSSLQNPSVTGAAVSNSGAYTVTAHFQGCNSTPVTTNVVVHPLPAATVTSGGPTTFCSGSNVVLAANTGAGLSYQWRNNAVNIPGAAGSTYTAAASGNYTVKVTTVNGCTAVSTPPVAVTVNPSPVSGIQLMSAANFCEGNSVVMNATAVGSNYTYQWYRDGNAIGGAVNNTYTATKSGLYTLKTTNGAGCSDLSAGVLITVYPVINPIITRNGNELSCSGYVAYQWYRNNTPIPGANAAGYQVSQNGYYQVLATDANGCTSMSAIAWIQDAAGVNAVVKTDEIKIFPNPATDVLYIQSPVPLRVALYNAQGQKLAEQEQASALSIAQLADGIYSLVVTDAQGGYIKTERIMKMAR